MKLSSVQRDQLRRWRADPLLWVRQELGVEPDKWQRRVLRLYGSNSPLLRIAMLACAGPGKSAVLAWILLHFITFMGHKDSHPQGLCLSKSEQNLKDNLWKEIGVWYRRSRTAMRWLELKRTRLQHRKYANTWFLSARAYAQTASEDEMGAALSGVHGQYVIIGLDETGTMPAIIGARAEQAFGTANRIRHRLISAGNPLSHAGLLYAQTVKQAKDHHVIPITADPDDPERTPRIDADWARRQIALRGRNSPWVKAHILGQFPDGMYNAILTRREVEAAMNRTVKRRDYLLDPMALGVDIGGDEPTSDRSVITPRQGLLVYPQTVLYSPSSYDGAHVVSRIAKERTADGIFLDGTSGHGMAWSNALEALGVAHTRIKFSRAADQPDEFHNKRAEMWWRMREWVQSGGCLPYDEELLEELTTPTYEYKRDRVLLSEKKGATYTEQRSTDKADSVALTFAQVLHRTNHDKTFDDYLKEHNVRDAAEAFDPFGDAYSLAA